VIHSRWAMLGVAGALAVELLGFGNWYDAPLWVSNRRLVIRCGEGGGGWLVGFWGEGGGKGLARTSSDQMEPLQWLIGGEESSMASHR